MLDAPSVLRDVAETSIARTSPTDDVVLLDAAGQPCGRARKCDVHGLDTPLHLAVSCYVVRPDGRLLMTRRSSAKHTWPGVWTNACCGHPRPGEALDDAVRRHMRDEIGVHPLALRVALPDFTYRATMANGWVEHELCPVYVAEVAAEPMLDPAEADAFEWLTWTELLERAAAQPLTLSPWSVTQIARLAAEFDDPLQWVRNPPPAGPLRSVRRPTDPFARMGRTVDDVIEAFMEVAEQQLAELDPLAAELTTPIRSLYAAGGKRLRPCLVHAGHAAVGAPDRTGHDIAHIAAAVEMLHTFALLHDDVMDRSILRRGRSTAHVHFADMHAGSRRDGDGGWFGSSAAIVAGDLAFVWADELLDQLTCTSEGNRRVRTVFNELRREVIAGQYLDLRLAGPCATDQQALSVALLKSARYTVTRPLEIGAALGHPTAAVTAALRTYGDAVGIAFQLRDDVLGVFGDPCVTGKGATDDLRSGKPSLLLVRALELSSPAGQDVLRRCLGRPDLDPADEDRCREAVRASGALASIEALIDAKLEIADRAVRCLPDEVADDLASLSHLLTHRHC